MTKLLCFVACFIAVALASHGRFGTIQFTKNAANPLEVTMTFNAAFRRTYFGGPNPGDTVYDASFDFGDGNWEQIGMYVQSIDTTLDLIVITWTGTHTYPSAGDYTVGWISCCRIFALNNNPSYSYAHTALIKITQAEIDNSVTVNNSPVSGMLAIIPVIYGVVPFHYQIVASDPENDPITYTMASADQQGDPSSSQPPGMIVNSATGEVTLTTVLAHGYWTSQQIVTDTFGNWISIDYLLDVQDPISVCSSPGCQLTNNYQCLSDADCAAVCSNANCVSPKPRLIINDLSSPNTPKTNRPTPFNGQTYNRNVGEELKVDFVADDANLPNPVDPVEIYQSNIPTGATLSTQVACNAASNCTCVGCNQKSQIRTLNWTPDPGYVGSNTLCIGVRSAGNYLDYAQHCITINVIAAPITSGEVTSKGLTTSPSLTTRPLTTDFRTVADRCATFVWPETQGYFCSNDHRGYYQCLKGPWATQARLQNCPAGTSCKCNYGVECLSQMGAVCTYGPYVGTSGSGQV